MGGDGGDEDVDDQDDDDQDNIPLSTRFQTMCAQSSLPAENIAAEDVEILDIPDSSDDNRGAGLV